MSFKANSLTNLATAYTESESDEENESSTTTNAAQTKTAKTGSQKGTKRAWDEHESSENNPNDDCQTVTRTKLEIPTGILDMFKPTEVCTDSSLSSEHQGRIRSFDHVAGNWATHVLIPINLPGHFSEFIDSLEMVWPEKAPQLHVMDLEDIHISISRTVPIRHHWINPLKESLQQGLERKRRFICSFPKISVYVNDEKSRSFLALDIDAGTSELKKLVTVVDKVFEEFGLPKYYEKPSFHASFSWTLGDVTEFLEESTLTKIQDLLDSYIDDYSALVFTATEVQYRTGNKTFHLPLSE